MVQRSLITGTPPRIGGAAGRESGILSSLVKNQPAKRPLTLGEEAPA
jgi:hypothetical protein